ncbi:hypothetical protein ACPPVW_14225 [Leifsonia sp. McL0607]|uniref:hypothetical protein n=1 Tax=Leifsonia sp. McL0607 TaxID=3415672 RepID=UPI003CF2155C
MIEIDARRLVAVLTRLRDQSPSEVSAPLYAVEDYFWSIPVEERYDTAATPTNLTIGQLTDSSSFLSDAVAGETVISYHAVWAADILHGIAGGAVTSEMPCPPLELNLSFKDIVDVGRRVVESAIENCEMISFSVSTYWTIDLAQMYQVLDEPTGYSRREVAHLVDVLRTDPDRVDDRIEYLNAVADVLELVGHRLLGAGRPTLDW